MQALAEAVQRLQCGARKSRNAMPAKGVGRGGRCVKHGGMSTGPRTPEGRARVSKAHASAA